MNTPTCQHCKSPFTPNPKRKGQRFCSERCRQNTYHAIRDKETPEQRDARLRAAMTWEPGDCLHCSGPLPVPRQAKQKTCCRKCGYAYYHKVRSRLPEVILREKWHGRLQDLIRRPSGTQSSLLPYIGCSRQSLIDQMQSYLPNGLCVHKGRQGWDIDHIIPISKFDLSKEDHLKVCFHHKNLRMVPSKVNQKKCDKDTDDAITPELWSMAQSIGITLPIPL